MLPPSPITTGPAADTPSISARIDALSDPNFMSAFARGLAVIRAFSDASKALTIAQISQRTSIPRAAVGRCLHTLRQLGYVEAELNNFSLRPTVLAFGHAYLSSAPLLLGAQPCLDRVSRTLGESCSLAVLDENEVLYLARSAASRVMSVSLGAGARLPAYCTSLGRVLLAYAGDDEIERYLAQVPLVARTALTVTDPAALRALLLRVRHEGYAINNEELEAGLRSIAVPVHGASGRVGAALIVGAHAARVAPAEMIERYLPVLRAGADELAPLLP